LRNGLRLKRSILVLLPALALACALPVATASAHGHGRTATNWHRGYWGHNAVVAGTVAALGSGSFSANAYVVTPGPGNTAGTPATTPATILTGSSTKVITSGQSGITVGDDFYAVYKGVPSSTPLSTIETDTPSVIYAFAAPTPQVEVKGVVTSAPASGSDTFTATAYVVTPPKFHPLPAGGSWGRGGSTQGWGGGYSYGGGVGGGYGYTPTAYHARGTRLRKANCLPGSTPASQGTPNTTITTDDSTQVTLNGQTSSVSSLTVGDKFTAVFDGTPNEPLSTIAATPAVSISAHAAPAPNVLYAFVGTVATTTPSSITVNVTNSIPTGLFSGTDTFTVSQSTIVLGNSDSSLFGSLSSVAAGDVVAGGVVGPSGQSASTIESDPLQVLVDFPTSLSTGSPTSSASPSTSITSPSVKRVERKAIKLLRREKAKLKRHHKQHGKRKK
jgi:hypothetical protein